MAFDGLIQSISVLSGVVSAVTQEALNAAAALNAIPSSTPSGDSSGATGTPSDEDVKRAELNIIELDEAAAKIGADVDKHKELVTAEEAVATKMGDHITDLQNTLTESNDQLQQMREAAGLGDASGVGAEKKKLTDDLNEARARLQYLEDTNAGAEAVAAQQKATDDLTAQMADAEKRFRVADYELTHGDAWQKQLQAIADQQAVIKAEQQKQTDEAKHLDEMKADLAAREADAQKLADERAAQQAILDKQQQDAQAAATAQRKADLQKELGDLSAATTSHIGIIHSAAAAAAQVVKDAVDQATTQLQDTAVQVSQTIATTASDAVAAAGTAITSQVQTAMQSLMDLVNGGPQTSQDVQGDQNNRDIGSQFAGQFFDETGNIGGGSITDATYASYVQSYIAAKKRSLQDTADGNDFDRFAQERQLMQLEALWQQLGGFARFKETLDQIYRNQQSQSTAITAISRTVNAPPPRAPMSPARIALYLPKVAPRPDPNKNLLAMMIRTGKI